MVGYITQSFRMDLTLLRIENRRRMSAPIVDGNAFAGAEGLCALRNRHAIDVADGSFATSRG
jgi:hypothetical protein